MKSMITLLLVSDLIVLHLISVMNDMFEVSGGSTAGCVLANRLSTSPNTTVFLIERGPLADTRASHVPLLSSDFASDGSRTYRRQSEFQPEIGTSIEFRPRCLGCLCGSGGIFGRTNVMNYAVLPINLYILNVVQRNSLVLEFGYYQRRQAP